MKKKRRTYRHGDVLLIEVEKVEGERLPHLTLAEGEVTGHAHKITSGKAVLFKFNDRVFLAVQSKIALLTHDEHKTLELPEGNFEVLKQREYSPEGWRYVAD